MYQDFFQLRANPFASSPDPNFLFEMPHTREALAALRYGISTHKGFVVLTGEVGTGKTTLLRCTLNSFDPERTLTSFLFNPRLETLDFLEFMLMDFGLHPPVRTKAAMLHLLNRWLIQQFEQGKTCVLIIDEAQNLSHDMLEEVRLLTNLETGADKLLQIVLSGQPELESRLQENNVRQLRQRVALWCRTRPLTADEIGPYIAARLQRAASPQRNTKDAAPAVFPAQVVASIYRTSAGIPRLVNLICEHSLIFSYVEQNHTITLQTVDAVVQDLGLTEAGQTTTAATTEAFPGQDMPGKTTEL